MIKPRVSMKSKVKAMKMNRIIRYTIMARALPAMLCFTACNDDDYMRFDLSHSGIYFTKDTLKYSFCMPILL